MAELTPRERLQPSLLDRLTDDEPEKQQESREQRVLSMRKLRQCVLRDMAWLLNSGNLKSIEDIDQYPYAACSVINYGLPDLAGMTVRVTDIDRLERMMRQVIQDYEPRILRNTIQVRAIVNDEHMNPNALSFEIEGELWGQPMPEHLFLKTEVDLESGQVRIDDSGSSGGR